MKKYLAWLLLSTGLLFPVACSQYSIPTPPASQAKALVGPPTAVLTLVAGQNPNGGIPGLEKKYTATPTVTATPTTGTPIPCGNVLGDNLGPANSNGWSTLLAGSFMGVPYTASNSFNVNSLHAYVFNFDPNPGPDPMVLAAYACDGTLLSKGTVMVSGANSAVQQVSVPVSFPVTAGNTYTLALYMPSPSSIQMAAEVNFTFTPFVGATSTVLPTSIPACGTYGSTPEQPQIYATDCLP